MDCGTCRGEGYLVDGSACPVCDGGGRREFNRCPTAILGAHHGTLHAVSRFMRAFRELEDRGDWPVPGGLSAQSTAFVEAVDVAQAEAARWKTMQIEYKETGP